jgi:hypothetical protein
MAADCGIDNKTAVDTLECQAHPMSMTRPVTEWMLAILTRTFNWTAVNPLPSTPPLQPTAFKLGAGALVTNLGSQPPATWPTFLKLYGQKAAGAAAAASLAIWPVLPELVRHWFYALCLSMTLGALWDFWCCMAVAFAGIPVRMCVWWGGGAELGEKMRGLASAGIWVCSKGLGVVGGPVKGGGVFAGILVPVHDTGGAVGLLVLHGGCLCRHSGEDVGVCVCGGGGGTARG